MNTTKNPRIYSKTTKTSVQPIQTSPSRKGRLSNNSKEDDIWVVLTADNGIAMVVMDKSSYVDKCMALLQDTNV